MLSIGAGTGAVLLLRWYWWRINAWSEISAMIAAAVVSLFLQSSYGPHWDSDNPQQFAYLMLTTVAITTVAWLTVTFLTPPESMETLTAFYRRVHPAGPGGQPWRQKQAPLDGMKVWACNSSIGYWAAC